MNTLKNSKEAGGSPGEPETWKLIRRALRDLQYGAVEITVHDARVVQVERREKIRPSSPPETR